MKAAMKAAAAAADPVAAALLAAIVVIAVVSMLADLPTAVDWWLVAAQTVLAVIGVTRQHTRDRSRGRAR